MSEIGVNSDDWTGRDASRAAPRGMSRKGYETVCTVLFGVGCLSLVILGFQLAHFDPSSFESWGRLFVPAVAALGAFAFRKTSPFKRIGRQR